MISIIIPIYNIEKYLSHCIDSVLEQTYKNLEIILVDDGSSDGSSEICDYYALKDARVQVIHKKNEGLVKARKDGLLKASGELIGYVDGDDWIEPQMYEKLEKCIKQYDVDIAMCGRYENTETFQKEVYHGIAEGKYCKQELLSDVYPNMIVNKAFFEWGIFPSVWDKLFKREALEKYQFDVDNRLAMGEDAACTYPALLNANSIYILHECLYHYRQTANSMVKQQKDASQQKLNFNVLYHSVVDSFERDKKIFDLSEQWKDYLLFLMIPRAETLLSGIEKLEYLFPFSNVKKGSRIIIYGMGTFGQLLYRYLSNSKFCEVEACVDLNYKELNRQGFHVIAPEEISKFKFDYVVIASSFAKAQEAIYKNLAQNIPKDKLQLMDLKLIKSNETLEAFGLGRENRL